MKTIKIVGLNPSKNIFVLTKNRNEWNQEIMTLEDFEEMMKTEFPTYWDEFEKSESESVGDFFFNYGYENGETYEFSN